MLPGFGRFMWGWFNIASTCLCLVSPVCGCLIVEFVVVGDDGLR